MNNAYENTPAGKTDFIKDVLTPLVIQANKGYVGAEYLNIDGEEYIKLLTADGKNSVKIPITEERMDVIVSKVVSKLREV